MINVFWLEYEANKLIYETIGSDDMKDTIVLIVAQAIFAIGFGYLNYRLDKIEDILKDKNNE